MSRVTVVIMACLSCLEGVVDGWKSVEVDALLLGPILVVLRDPLNGPPSLPEVPVRVMDGEAVVSAVAARRCD